METEEKMRRQKADVLGKENKNFNYVIQIDDDPFVITRQKLIIQKRNLSSFFQTANHGKMALQKLYEIKNSGFKMPAYIIVDLNMPHMNGLEFIEEFRKNFYNSSVQTKIIIASSSITNNIILDTKRYPFITGFIRKPLPDDFVEELITRPVG